MSWAESHPASPGGSCTEGDAAPSAAAPAGRLDLHEEISDPRTWGCLRWPELLRLRSNHGELVMGRCGAVNMCDYCAKLAAVENSEMLALDADQGNAPEVWLVLTTRWATTDMAVFYRAHEQLMKALKRRFPELQWSRLLEFTTGYGPKSGGLRRPHWNCLLKGVPRSALDVVRELVEKVWCPRVDALPQSQHVGEVAEVGGLMRYIALHFQKESQAPPKGFRGHRFTSSRGYFGEGGTAAARERARASLRFKRELRKAVKLGLSGQAADDHAAAAIALAEATTWELAHLKPPKVERNPLPTVPAAMLEAAFRWQDEREAIDEAYAQEVTTAQPVGHAAPARKRSASQARSWDRHDQGRDAVATSDGLWGRQETFDRGWLMRRLKLLERWADV